MAKVYCAVERCPNKSDNQRTFCFFKLPADAERRQLWLQVIGRSDFLKRSDFKFTSHCICSAHFDESYLVTKKYLTPDAIPTKLLPGTLYEDGNKASKPKTAKLYEDKEAADYKRRYTFIADGNQKIKEVASENNNEASISSEPKKAKLDKNNDNEKVVGQNMFNNFADWQIKLKDKIITDLLSKPSFKDNDEASTSNEAEKVELGKNKEENKAQNTFLKLAEWQKKIKTLNGPEHKIFALNLYFASPHTYRLLKSLFELPDVRTLHRFKVPLRLDDRVISSLALKMKSYPTQAKYCTLCLGEMKLKPHLYYDTKEDELLGFHSVDGNVTNKIATRAYVIMLQGIFHKWNQPLSYAFHSDTEHQEDLGSWVDNTILTLQKIGIEVKAIISDPDSYYNKFANDIKGVTVEKPYFLLNELKVYYIFNVPLLLCSVRDAMEASNFVYEGHVISWDYIQMLHNKEDKNGLRLIPKLTVAHVHPEKYLFHKPRVELAAQVFSQTVATALETYIHFNSLPQEAKATAKFIQTMDDLFDVLNSSKVKSDKPLQLAFKDLEEQRNVLKEALRIFSTIEITNVIGCATSIKETFEKFQITIKAFWQMYRELSDLGFKSIFTRRLNKDSLEVFLGHIVWKEAAGPKPTAAKFSKAFSKLFLSNMLQHTRWKCTDMLTNADDVLSQAYNTKYEPAPPSSILLDPANKDHQMDLPVANALTYISGYLVYKCFEQHKCEILANFMNTARLSEPILFTKYKHLNTKAPFYGKLRLPPPQFVEYVGRLETAFVNNCLLLTHERPVSKIFEAVLATPGVAVMLCPCFPIEYCVKLFLRLRIYTTLRYNQREIKQGQRVISVEHL